MKVVLVSPWGSARCGLRTYSRFLAGELSKHVELWVVPHYRYALPDRDYARWLAWKVNSLKPDIVHVQHEYGVWNPWDPWVFVEFLRRVEARKVVTMHSTGFEWEKPISELADAVVVHNRFMYETFKGDRGKCFIIPHGCVSGGSKIVSKEHARRRLGLNPNSYIVGVFGFIDPRKGHDLALEAYRRLKGVEMVFVGGWHSERVTPWVSLVLREAGRLGVRTVGYVDDEKFELWLQAVDVVLHPSRAVSESGIVCYALGLGKPVVVSDHPAFQGKPVLKFRTVEELVSLVVKLRDPGFRARWETFSRRYGEMFSWSRVAWLHHHLYRFVLTGSLHSLRQLNGVKEAVWQMVEVEKHGSPDVVRVQRERVEWVKSKIKHPCLDVGSGIGFFGADVNLDVSAYRLMLGKLLNPRGEYVVGDAHHLPFRSKAFKQTLLCEVLEHVEEPVKVLREAGRVSEETVVTVPDEKPPYMSHMNPEHLRFYSRVTLLETVGKAGLKTVEYKHITGGKYAWHCLVVCSLKR